VIDSLNDEKRQLKSSHTDEIKRYQQDVALVQVSCHPVIVSEFYVKVNVVPYPMACGEGTIRDPCNLYRQQCN